MGYRQKLSSYKIDDSKLFTSLYFENFFDHEMKP